MKILVCLLIVMAVVGSSWGDDEDGGGSSSSEDAHLVGNFLIEKAVKCLVPGNGDGPDIDFLGQGDSLDKARDLFREYCHHYPDPVAKCLEEVNADWEKSQKEDERKDFGLFRDFLTTSLEIACVDDGERLTKTYQELQPNPDHEGPWEGLLSFMMNCMREVNINIVDGNEPLRERIFQAYRRLKSFWRCFRVKGKDVFVSTKEIVTMIDEISRKMKCLHPKSKKFVLCSALNEDGTGDRKCPVRFENKDQQLIRGELIDAGFQCLLPSPEELNISKQALETGYGEVSVDYCDKMADVKHCLFQVTSWARLCLDNTTRHKVFEIFQEMLETSLEIACSNDGVQLAHVIFGNYNRSSSSGEHRDVVGECTDISVTKIKHVPDMKEDDAATMSLRMYQEVGAFEECITDNIQVDTFREVAHTFINDVMNKIKCVHPKEGVSVSCKSIVDAF